MKHKPFAVALTAFCRGVVITTAVIYLLASGLMMVEDRSTLGHEETLATTAWVAQAEAARHPRE